MLLIFLGIYTTYSWLSLCTTRHKAFCTYCRYCSSTRKSEDTFLVSGFDNWKKAHEIFVQHEISNTHKEALLKIVAEAGLSKQAQTHRMSVNDRRSYFGHF